MKTWLIATTWTIPRSYHSRHVLRVGRARIEIWRGGCRKIKVMLGGKTTAGMPAEGMILDWIEETIERIRQGVP